MKVRFGLKRTDRLLNEEEYYPSLVGELVDGVLTYVMEDGTSSIAVEENRIVPMKFWMRMSIRNMR